MSSSSLSSVSSTDDQAVDEKVSGTFGSHEIIKRAHENRIIINVGGIKFETYKSTLRNIPDTRLAWLTQTTTSNVDFDAKAGEYFFDRHAGVFQHILNFYRTGKLHAPLDVCGPMYEEELSFWGIDEKQIEPCCWNNYRTHRDAEQQMAEFAYMLHGASDDDEDGSNDDQEEENNVAARFGLSSNSAAATGKTRWQKLRPKVWKLLDNPASSRAAKWCNFLSFFVVAVSILTFCLLTLPSIEPNFTATSHVDNPFACLFPREMHRKCNNNSTICRDTDDFTWSDRPPINDTLDGAFQLTPLNLVLSAINSTNSDKPNNLSLVQYTAIKKNSDDRQLLNFNRQSRRPHCPLALVALNVVDATCVLFFTVEFFIRLGFAPDRRVFFRSLYTYYDILAFVPFYLQRILILFLPIDSIASNIALKLLNFTRIFRVFRVFRVARNVTGIKILMQTLKTSSNELLLLVSVLVLAMLIFSSCIYYAQVIELAFSDVSLAEHQQQLGADGTAVITSVPTGLWWAAITLTTVGYGDKRPTTNIGFFIGFFCAVSSALSLSLPVPIIVNNFAKYYQFVQAQMRLPKKKRRMLAQAPDALKQQSAEYATMENSSTNSSSGSSKIETDNDSQNGQSAKTVPTFLQANGNLSNGLASHPKKVSFISPIDGRRLSSGANSIASLTQAATDSLPNHTGHLQPTEMQLKRREIANRIVSLAIGHALALRSRQTNVLQNNKSSHANDLNALEEIEEKMRLATKQLPQTDRQVKVRPLSRRINHKSAVDERVMRRASIAPVAS